MNKEAGAVLSALTNQWPTLIALIADTNLKIFLYSFCFSCSVWWNTPPGNISCNFSLWWNISTSSSAPYTLLVLKWLLLCHYYCRQTRLSKTSKIIKYEDWETETEPGHWLVRLQKHQKCYVRMCLQLSTYRVETRDILYPDKSLLIGCSCRPIQLDISTISLQCLASATQPYIASQFYFSPGNVFFQPDQTNIITNLIEQLTAV